MESLNLPKTEEEKARSVGLTYIELDIDIDSMGNGNDIDYDYKLEKAHAMLDKQIRILEEIDTNIKSFLVTQILAVL